MPQKWKEIAIKRYCLAPGVSDENCLDEVARHEVNGGGRLMRMKEQVTNMLYAWVENGSLDYKLRNELTDAFGKCMRPLRAEAKRKLIKEVAELEETGVMRDDYQPPAEYRTKKVVIEEVELARRLGDIERKMREKTARTATENQGEQPDPVYED